MRLTDRQRVVIADVLRGVGGALIILGLLSAVR
jgi:hypothetical protein